MQHTLQPPTIGCSSLHVELLSTIARLLMTSNKPCITGRFHTHLVSLLHHSMLTLLLTSSPTLQPGSSLRMLTWNPNLSASYLTCATICAAMAPFFSSATRKTVKGFGGSSTGGTIPSSSLAVFHCPCSASTVSALAVSSHSTRRLAGTYGQDFSACTPTVAGRRRFLWIMRGTSSIVIMGIGARFRMLCWCCPWLNHSYI